MNDYFQLILMIICTPFALVWICLAITKGKKYATYTKSTFAREFQMSKLFCVGFALMPILHMGTKTRRAKLKNQRDCRDQGQEVCGILLLYFAGRQDHICIYCVPCIYASFGPGGKCGGGTSGSYLQRAGSHVYRPIFAGQADSQKAGDPDGSSTGVVQAYASGHSGNGSPRCWEKTAITGERALYKEMQNTSLEIDNGIMEADAYRNFADRCSVKEVRKFTSLILQNLQKGNEELALFLGDMSTEMWEMKKNEVKQKGRKSQFKTSASGISDLYRNSDTDPGSGNERIRIIKGRCRLL